MQPNGQTAQEEQGRLRLAAVLRNAWLLVPAMAVASALLAVGAAGAPRTWPVCSATSGPLSIAELRAARRVGDVRAKLWSHICGPTKVIPGRNYSFTVVVTNISDTHYRRLTLWVSHYLPLARASVAYRREDASNGDPRMQSAVWTLTNFKPGQSFRVSFTLPFTRHPDPKASNVEVDAFVGQVPAYPTNLLGFTHDVVFIRGSSSP